MESIKDKVAIVGMGCSKFGEHWDLNAWDLVIEAVYEAFEDAGVGPKDIQAAWSGTLGFAGGQKSQHRHLLNARSHAARINTAISSTSRP